jgi:hypothetical protein
MQAVPEPASLDVVDLLQPRNVLRVMTDLGQHARLDPIAHLSQNCARQFALYRA